MKRKQVCKWWHVVVLGGFFVGACGTARMSVPPDVALGSHVLEAKNRTAWSGLKGEGFDLGPYKIEQVDRNWDSSSGWIVGAVSAKDTTGSYTFKFVSAEARLTGKCGAGAKGADVALHSGVSLAFRFAKLACSCENGSTVATVVIERNDRSYEGTLVASGRSYAIRSIHGLEGAFDMGSPTGYRVDGVGPIGAVEVLRPGRVWLKEELNEAQRTQTTCLFAGLMLYQPPTD